MQNCYSCYGSGKKSCSSCGGKGYVSSFSSLGVGGMDTSGCLTCSGTGKVTCSVCSGTGKGANHGKNLRGNQQVNFEQLSSLLKNQNQSQGPFNNKILLWLIILTVGGPILTGILYFIIWILMMF